MLLIDGVKYELWTPPSEDDFERMVTEHTQEIFGEQSIYIDRKQKLKSISGIGSIPDGYAIAFNGSPQWHIVEMELSSHPLHEHIVAQVSKFITGISNPNIQRTIVNALDQEIAKDDFLRLKLRKAIEPTETYRFLSDLIARPPVLSIIIEKDTEGLREALSTLNHAQIKVIEFQTFKRVGAEAVHAHLFEPLFGRSRQETEPTTQIGVTPIGVGHTGLTPGKKAAATRLANRLASGGEHERITARDLVDTGLLKVGQVLFRTYKGQRYEGRILGDGGFELANTGQKFPSFSTAANSIAGSVNAWVWWYTARSDGTKCLLDELREKYRAAH